MRFKPSRVNALLPLTCLFVLPAFAQTATDPNEGFTITQDASANTLTLSWWGRAGHTYFLQSNPDLTLPWTYLPVIETGADAILQYTFELPTENPPDRWFWRTQVADQTAAMPAEADFDGDGLTNLDEIAAGGDPLDFYNGVAPTFEIVSGNGQRGVLHQLLAQPLVVRVKKPDGTLWANAPVVYQAQDGSKLGATAVEAIDSTTGRLTVTTDANGLARIYVRYE